MTTSQHRAQDVGRTRVDQVDAYVSTATAGRGIAGALVAAIEQVWAGVQRRHPDVPDVVVTIGQGSGARSGALRLGHFAPSRWQVGEDAMHELFVGGEGLRRGAVDLLGTLLHEATHGAAAVRGIKDTSRQGRYHNAKFKVLGEELGLALECDPSIGWSVTAVPAATADLYAAEVEALGAVLTAWRRAESVGGAGKKKSNNGVSLECLCGRKVRASKSVAAAGPITCGLCGGEFTAPDSDEGEPDGEGDG